jgi:hypothetical protein
MPGEFSLATADMDQYLILLAGVALSQGAGQSGYADGEFFNGKQMKPSFTAVEGTDGSVARSKTNSRLCEMTLSFLQTAQQNNFLTGLLTLDENAPNGAGIGSFELRDMQGTTLILCSRAWITGPAEVVLNRGVEARKWTLNGIRSIWAVGSN